MADIDSALVVRIEATLAKFERQMARARKVGGDSAVDIERRMGRANEQVAATANRAATAMERMSNISGRGRFMIQNASYQLGDLAVQLGSGTRASVALGQQLPQLLGGFGTLGAILGTVAAIGIPAAAFAFRNLGTEAQTVEDALKEVEVIAKSLEGPMAILTMDGQTLANTYGEAAERVREFAIVQAELAVAQARARLGDQIQILDDVVDGFITSATEGLAFERTLESINEAFGTTRDQAIILEKELENIFIAARTGTFEDGRAALQSFLDRLREMELPLGNIPELLRVAINEVITLSNSMDAAAQSTNNLAAAAAGVTIGVPLTIPPGGAVDLLPPTPLAPAKAPRTTAARAPRIDPQVRQDEMERERLMKSSRTQAEAYADELIRLQDLHARGVIDGDLFNRALDQMHNNFDQNTRAIDRMADAGAAMFTSIIDGSMSAKQALAQLLNQLAGTLMQSAASGLIGSALTGTAAGGFLGGLFANAKGNAFSNGHVTPFAQGGVVNGPTMFPMRVGTGLMGEAGPEAIMPLARTANGKLGVQTAGAGGGEVVVRVMISEGPMFAANVQAISQGTAVRVVQEYDRRAAPATVQRSLADPRRRG